MLEPTPREPALDFVGEFAVGDFGTNAESQEQTATLRARRSQLASAFELARLGPWEYDVESDRFTFNDHFYAIFRTSAEREGGYTMPSTQYAQRFLHPEDRGVVEREIQRALDTTDPNYTAQLEHRIIYADGEVGYISVSVVIAKDEHGRTIKTYGVNQDITERVRARAALQAAHDQLRVLHENVDDALFSYDWAHRKMLYASPAHERIYGYPPRAFFENPMLWLERVLPEDRPLLDAVLLGRQGAESCRRQFRILHRGGRVRWLEARVKASCDERGALIRVDGIISDISERVEADARRQRLEAQLRQAQKFESLGTLAGGIAHDFNNILGIIVGYASLLESSKQDPQLVGKALAAISRATTRGTDLVSQLLTFAREADVDYSLIDVNAVALELVALCEETFPKSIAIRFDLKPNLPMIAGNASQIHQLLLNLCINGRDAMPDGGTLTLSTELVGGASVQAQFPSATAATYMRIRVRDTGVGMTEVTRQRLFDPFFTTKGVGKGTGLGLAVALGIVEGHRGHIGVQSTPGCGTVFDIYFEVAEGQRSERRAAERSDAEELRGGTETVLVIEDEELLRCMLQSAFEAQGYVVLTAGDGLHGVQTFEQHRDEIAAVVSDVDLPEMSGFEVVQKIRASNARVKHIITSGLLTPELSERLQAVGVSSIIPKPFEPRDVLRALRSAMDQRG